MNGSQFLALIAAIVFAGAVSGNQIQFRDGIVTVFATVAFVVLMASLVAWATS